MYNCICYCKYRKDCNAYIFVLQPKLKTVLQHVYLYNKRTNPVCQKVILLQYNKNSLKKTDDVDTRYVN